MIIGSTHNLRNKVCDSTVTLNGKFISGLGVLFHEKLISWEEHIGKICKKVGAGIAVMKRVKPFVPPDSLQMIYNAMILQPYFDYCLPLWGNFCYLFKDKLLKFQNRAARIIAGVNYEVNSADVLEFLGWETLEERRIRNKSVLMYRILNGYTALSLRESFTTVGTLQRNYNLRNSHTDLAVQIRKGTFLKKNLNIAERNYGIAFLRKLN